MTQARFTHLQVSAQFDLHSDPESSIYDDLEREHTIEIFVLDKGLDEVRSEQPVKAGKMKASLFRFDGALNLGKAPEEVADAHSGLAWSLYDLMESDGERNPIGGGLHRDTVMLHSIELRDDLQGTRVEYEAVRVALIGLSSGVSRAFLLLEEGLRDMPGELNVATLRYAPIGFRPVELGSNLLWIDIESADFWHI